MLSQVLKTINRYEMFEPGEKVLVAVSGGPDSMALLHVLTELKSRLCLDLYVAHLDHGIRKSSRKDLELVKRECASRGVPFITKTLCGLSIKTKGSLEDRLRRLRYEFLLKSAAQCGTKKIAVGHTKDDQAETILMRLLRGSGLYGLSAILPKRHLCGREIVRPLIETSRRDVIRFLKKNKVPFGIDETNSEDRFMRNRVRKELLPLLEKRYNPSVKDVLSAAALSVGADYDLLSREARDFLDKNLKNEKTGPNIPENAARALDVAIRRLVYRHIIADWKGDLRRISFKHIEELEALLFLKPEGSEVHLPGGLVVVKVKKKLRFLKR